MGIDPCLIVTTDKQGEILLRSLAPMGMNLEHVHVDGKLSSTVSLEMDYNGRRVNLMISDSGSASSFSFNDLSEDDLKSIRESSLVALVNLNHNLNGVELAQDLFRFVRENSDAITFVDMGDPSWNKQIVEPLVKDVISEGLVDVLSSNENEAAWFAWALTNKDDHWRDLVSDSSRWLSIAELVSNETSTRIDFHTPKYSASLFGDDVVTIPTFDVESRIMCGAGDAWNAGDILGHISKLSIENRLILANAVAALYVSSEDATHPTANDLRMFLDTNPPLFRVNE